MAVALKTGMALSAFVSATMMALALVAAGGGVSVAEARGATPAGQGRAIKTYASWYGEPHHGRPTASGEEYDMWKMTAAHRTLPFGTEVTVTNLRNGRRVTVRVNDRGPMIPGRGIDLSYAAARALGAVRPGVIPVRVTVRPPARPTPTRR
jgi:rare lipoprotein A